MTGSKNLIIIPAERIVSRIFLIRGKKVMIDRDLAELYCVSTGNFNKAVTRNLSRFPEDFMFQLNKEEFKNLIFHFGTSSWGGIRKLPWAYTEQGVAMLSSVLNSERAIQVNIQIIRTFTKLRELLQTNSSLRQKIENLERKYEQHNKKFRVVFDLIAKLIKQEEEPKREMGFRK